MILKQHKNYFGFFGKQLILEKNLKVPLNCAFDKGSKYAEVKKVEDIVSNLFDNKKDNLCQSNTYQKLLLR